MVTPTNEWESLMQATESPDKILFIDFKNDSWVTMQLEKMTLDEKIAQLMMITAYPKQSEASKAEIIDLIKKKVEKRGKNDK